MYIYIYVFLLFFSLMGHFMIVFLWPFLENSVSQHLFENFVDGEVRFCGEDVLANWCITPPTHAEVVLSAWNHLVHTEIPIMVKLNAKQHFKKWSPLVSYFFEEIMWIPMCWCSSQKKCRKCSFTEWWTSQVSHRQCLFCSSLNHRKWVGSVFESMMFAGEWP